MKGLTGQARTRRRTAGAARDATGDSGGDHLPWLAVLAALAATAIALLLAASVALVGWFLADAGAHGDTTAALGVGRDLWLLALGGGGNLAGIRIGLVPLGLTLVVLTTVFRCGRWAGRRVPAAQGGTLALATAVFAAGHTVVAVLVAVTAGSDGAGVSLPRATSGAAFIGLVAGGVGLAVGTGWWQRRSAVMPWWALTSLRGAAATVLLTLAAGGLVTGGALLAAFNDMSLTLTTLDLDSAGMVSLAMVLVSFAPNVVLLGTAWLLGPGFAVGADTVVSPTLVVTGDLPVLPFFAAVPLDGTRSDWMLTVLIVPALAAAVGAAAAARAVPGRVPGDVATLVGAAAGLLGAVLITGLITAAGGALGDGRLADIGAPPAQVLVFSAGLMTAGGSLGALVAAWRGRRRERAEATGPDRRGATGSTSVTWGRGSR